MAKEKKEKTEIKLPKAWATMKRRNETSQARKTYDEFWKVMGTVVIIALILFVLLGGINQRKAWETLKKWGNNVASAIAGIFNLGDIEVNDDGVYLRLDGTSSTDTTEVSGSDNVSESTEEDIDASDFQPSEVSEEESTTSSYNFEV